MVRRAAIVLGAGSMVVLTAVSIVVIGIRTKYPPVLNRVRRYARDVGNPRQLKSAGTPGANASILRHTGRSREGGKKQIDSAAFGDVLRGHALHGLHLVGRAVRFSQLASLLLGHEFKAVAAAEELEDFG